MQCLTTTPAYLSIVAGELVRYSAGGMFAMWVL
jgi:hypothetical protein